MIVGILACVTATFTFGTVFVPIKAFPASDGFMVQFFMSLGGFIVSLGIHAVLEFPPIYALAMLGGALWCTANSFAFLIMNRLGLAVPILVWNTVSCLTGWATSRFGLFGVPKGVPGSILLNYTGVCVLVVGSSFFLFIKSHVYRPKSAEKLASGGEIPSEKSIVTESTSENDDPHHVPVPVRIGCLIAAVVSGFFYGSMCTPVTFIQNRPDLYPGAPTEGLPYVFSFFCGVLPTSTAVLAIYSGFKRNNPSLPPYLVLPSLVAGLLFAIGMGGFFIGNEKLSQTIAYPVISFAPGLVVSAWSVLHFKEITGKRNLILLAIAYTFTLVGVGMKYQSERMSNHAEIRQKNDLYLEKMELTDKFVKLHEKLRNELDLASLCVSKAKAAHGFSLFSVNSVDSHDLEPSVRIEIDDGKFEILEKDEEEGAEELKTKNSGESEDVECDEDVKKSPFAGQFRPFGVLEPTAAKDARKTMKNAIQTLLDLATTQHLIAVKTRELTGK